MKNIKNIAFIILAGFVMFLCSCEYETIQPKKVVIDPGVTIKYSTDIAPALNDNCASCHSGSREPDLRTATSYNSLKTGGFITAPGSTSKLVLKIAAGHMTSSSISAETKAKLIKWIDDGAANN